MQLKDLKVSREKSLDVAKGKGLYKKVSHPGRVHINYFLNLSTDLCFYKYFIFLFYLPKYLFINLNSGSIHKIEKIIFKFISQIDLFCEAQNSI